VIPIIPKNPHAGATIVVLARNQPEYDPLPAAVSQDGLVMTEWEFTAEELAAVLAGGRLRLRTFTFGHPFQPVQLEVVE
jgi:hypothetical protein